MVEHDGLMRVFWPTDIPKSDRPGVVVGWRNSNLDVFVVAVLDDVDVRTYCPSPTCVYAYMLDWCANNGCVASERRIPPQGGHILSELAIHDRACIRALRAQLHACDRGVKWNGPGRF
jgi:hypothetical protein